MMDNSGLHSSSFTREPGTTPATSSSHVDPTTVHSHRHPADILPPVSEKILKMIQAGEFIEFSLLLPSIAPPGSENLHFQITPNSMGDAVMTVAKPPPKPKILNFSSWLAAWNIFVAVWRIFFLTSLVNYFITRLR